ncbi:MAG: glutamate--tRNA ligase [Rhodothermales bacterium]|nr:glutamate--tRNA ligase [Rhodothermales bacterium]MBO6781642.1 glutamate--tRNA ligase [Rhodothermales bacterium]
MSPVRVRFAPSPTGYLHIGGLRTALYNYLLARQTGGAFVLRIEDTDRTRFVEDAEGDIRDSLAWAGLSPDESPDIGGAAGPYRQSERSALYREHADRLIASGAAYYAFDTPEEIDAMRERLKTPENPTPRYDASTRASMRNSLTLPAEEVSSLIESGTDYVVRLKVDPGATVTFQDAVRGSVTFASDVVDDQVLVKSDGLPTYHLANVVDDHFMEITHVIRGEEWLSSTPKHVLLYEALGWTAPEMAHLPLILSPTGGKLSKRAAERQGIPVLVRQYRDLGYEPEALINYLALLGWNPGDEREVFALGDLVDAFSLERVGSAGVQFDLEKLGWFNGQHIRRRSLDSLAADTGAGLRESGIEAADGYVSQVVALMQDRVGFAGELVSATGYFFRDPEEFDPNGLKKRWKDDSAELVTAYADRISELHSVDEEALEGALRGIAEERGVGAGRIIHPVRLALSGVSFGPGLFEMMAVLGKETCVRRLRAAAERLG